jgi:predicted nucleotidyltransferase
MTIISALFYTRMYFFQIESVLESSSADVVVFGCGLWHLANRMSINKFSQDLNNRFHQMTQWIQTYKKV